MICNRCHEEQATLRAIVLCPGCEKAIEDLELEKIIHETAQVEPERLASALVVAAEEGIALELEIAELQDLLRRAVPELMAYGEAFPNDRIDPLVAAIEAKVTA